MTGPQRRSVLLGRLMMTHWTPVVGIEAWKRGICTLDGKVLEWIKGLERERERTVRRLLAWKFGRRSGRGVLRWP
jgi:hypothetical protein